MREATPALGATQRPSATGAAIAMGSLGRARPAATPRPARHPAFDSRGNAVFFAHALAIGLLVSAPGGVAPDNSDSSAPTAFTNHPVAPSPKPDRASLTSGSRAPDFQYQSYDAMWQHLHNVLEHGDVLLVFGCSDLDLQIGRASCRERV